MFAIHPVVIYCLYRCSTRKGGDMTAYDLYNYYVLLIAAILMIITGFLGPGWLG